MNGSPKLPAALTRAINRFDNAAQAYAFRGEIPRYESDVAEATYTARETEYEYARQLLERAIRRYVGT